ncbi:MAG: hypothetical protein HYZ17_07490 [Betaproteobacteria bacterium]|nr:hypothetical protein [Betaproteobacteria bacterium]
MAAGAQDQNRFAFHRPALASDLCHSLEGRGLMDSSSGLFLAAPRRTGKSTFLREDLLPEARRRHWRCIYVDLWSDRSRDPAQLLAAAVKQAIAEQQGLVTRMARSAGLDKVNLMGTLSFDPAKVAERGGITLADALSDLADKLRHPILLIVDEAQHALTSEPGINAMFALKAARDRINSGGRAARLLLVFTGSHRDKLAHLVVKKDQPFFGSQVTSFPLLKRDFTDAYTAWVNAHLAPDNQFDQDDMFEAFVWVGHRPEMLKALISEIALERGQARRLGKLLKDGASSLRNRVWESMESEISGLSELQRAVLEVMVRKGKDFSPFTEDSLKEYRALLGQPELAAHTVQAALEGLRERNLIWRSARGAYALEDEALAEWFAAKPAPTKRA